MQKRKPLEQRSLFAPYVAKVVSESQEVSKNVYPSLVSQRKSDGVFVSHTVTCSALCSVDVYVCGIVALRLHVADVTFFLTGLELFS